MAKGGQSLLQSQLEQDAFRPPVAGAETKQVPRLTDRLLESPSLLQVRHEGETKSQIAWTLVETMLHLRNQIPV